MGRTHECMREQRRLHFSNQYAILTGNNEDDQGATNIVLAFLARLVVYVAILALLVIIVCLIIKYLRDCDGEAATEQMTSTETNRLLPNEGIPSTYRTYDEDLETGKCSNRSSEDLYDGKICIICYDKQRNCFFNPCGHSNTCHACAQRIVDGENKACPVCRRFIQKVSKLFTS